MLPLLFIETLNAGRLDEETLGYHAARMMRTAQHFGFDVVPIDRLLRSVERALAQEGWAKGDDVRCSVTYGPLGIVEVRTIAYRRREAIAMVAMEVGESIDYAYKWADRSMLDELKAGAVDGAEPLLLRHGLVTDTTFTNIVVEREDGALYTPATPLLEGTMRARLIDHRIVQTGAVTLEDIRSAKRVHLINAMNPLGTLVGLLK